MRKGLLDHIDLRVKNMEKAMKFYQKFLPQLGFVKEKYEPSPSPEVGEDFCTYYSAGKDTPAEFFGICVDKNHRPNGTRIAFWAETRQKVDDVAKLIRDAGGQNLEGPELCVEYSPGYYAFFFEDPDGNKLEICCRETPIVAG